MIGCSMKVALLNTYETGGAARACYRLFQGLISAESDAELIVRGGAHSTGVISAGSSWGGFIMALLDGIPLHCYSGRQLNNFSPAWVPGRGIYEATRFSPDIVHLHWIVQGFVQIESMTSISCPIVWTLHDSWPFTGGCHLPGNCRRYEHGCGQCPVLGSNCENDLSRRIWRRKHEAWKNLSLTIVCPSKWLAERAGASSLLRGRRIVVIPNGIDTVRYSPGDKLAARRKLGLPENRSILLYGANQAISDKNKGLDLLLAAFRLIEDTQLQDTELVIFGEDTNATFQESRLHIRNLGSIHDEDRLLLLYRAADIFVAPSRQENLPNMVMEAMACGTPCVAFAVGGIPDLITHGETGYLAQPFEIEDLAQGLSQLILDVDRRVSMSLQSREWIENNVSMTKIVALYQNIYRELAAK
jgi:glycosyltransferase involved in cell wall biosynthesis